MFPELTLLLLLLSTPHLSPTIQLSDMCFIATAVLLTILQSLSDNHILMNNIFASPFPAQSLLSLSLLSLSAFSLSSCYPSSISIPFVSLLLLYLCFLYYSDTTCRSVPRRSLYRTLSDESLCSSHRRALSLASSRSSMLDQAMPNDILFSSVLPYHSTLPPRMGLNHAASPLKSECLHMLLPCQ